MSKKKDLISESATEWIISKDIIKKFLRELRPDLNEEQHDHNAAAILARLAQNNPPILATFSHNIKR